MMTRKHLRRARRRIGAGALGAQSSLRLRLESTASCSPDPDEAQAAAHALAVLAAHEWHDSGWDALGLPKRARQPVNGVGSRR